jgi:hypothetical protein
VAGLFATFRKHASQLAREFVYRYGKPFTPANKPSIVNTWLYDYVVNQKIVGGITTVLSRNHLDPFKYLDFSQWNPFPTQTLWQTDFTWHYILPSFSVFQHPPTAMEILNPIINAIHLEHLPRQSVTFPSLPC